MARGAARKFKVVRHTAKSAKKSARDRHACAVVGIGASAGGLEAFERFFTGMPTDSGLAFVLVPHLDARHPSAMVDLIRRYTEMPVKEITDQMEVRPNQVHVIPPNAMLTIADCKLQISTPRTRPLTIDTFLHSLAEDQKENAIGVILSGSGSDGALGIKAIKEHGGLTIAQARAGHDSMPVSAAATGLVDFVVPVDEIPQRLVDYAQHLVRMHGGKGPDGVREEMRKFLPKIYTMLRNKTGHDFSRYKDSTFIRRVQRRMQVVQLESVPAYVELLRKDGREVEFLFRDLLIGVTQFFRDKQAFDALARDVIPEIVKGKAADDHIRIWVAGCSTGEEAYSIAILLKEQLQHSDTRPKVQIFATDLDANALEAARTGRYAETIARDVSPQRLERFFLRDGQAYRVIKDIREMCIFSVHNLIKDAPFAKLDLVSCRNLLIYLDSSLQNRVIPLFHFALRPGGYLFLGPSENVTQQGNLFGRVDARHRLFEARKNGARRQLLEFPIDAAQRNQPAPPGGPTTQSTEDSVSRRAMRLMEGYTPAYVVIDDNTEVVHFSGGTGKYLQPTAGAASFNLFNLVDASLRADVRTLLHQHASGGSKVVQENVPFNVEGGEQRLNIIVEPLPASEDGARYTVIAFQEAGPVRPPGTSEPRTGTAAQKDETFALIEQELMATRERLQATIEELETSNEEMKASNEELQSVNEELQSSNEELETSKEELQSVNEELETINTELNSKLESLERATNDRKNLLESTQIATIFLDNALRIKSFTPAITDIFHLIDADFGRPITDLVMKLDYTDLARDVKRVIRTLSRIEQEVSMVDGSASYLMRILPYRTVDNMIDGVVITFIDITERRKSEEDLARLASIVATSHDAIIGFSLDGTITTWNAGAERMYGYQADEAVGRPFTMLIKSDRKRALKEILDRLKRSRAAVTVDAERMTKKGERMIVASTVSPLRSPDGKIVAASVIEREITASKHAEERQRMLLAELNHRVKNTLASVLSISSRTARNSRAIDDFREAFEGRIRALARAHELLAATSWAGADLRAVVQAELTPYGRDGRIDISGDPVTLSPSAALVLGIALHELATNAAKYGAFSTGSGDVAVAWRKNGRMLSLGWVERNGPKITRPSRRGFGLRAIERGLAGELQGRARIEFPASGLRCTLEIPLNELRLGKTKA